MAAGKLSAGDAEGKMIEIEKQIASKQQFALRFEEELASRMQNEGLSKTEAYLDLAAEKLDEIVQTGELSAEDAEAKMIGLQQEIAFKQERASRREKDAESDTEAHLEEVAAKLDAMVQAGKLSAEDAEAKLIAIENSVAAKSKRGSLDARSVLRAAKRVDLKPAQKEEIRAIERAVQRVHSAIPRKDKQRRSELAEQVKAEITKLLDANQTEQFEAALKRLNRTNRRSP